SFDNTNQPLSSIPMTGGASGAGKSTTSGKLCARRMNLWLRYRCSGSQVDRSSGVLSALTIWSSMLAPSALLKVNRSVARTPVTLISDRNIVGSAVSADRTPSYSLYVGSLGSSVSRTGLTLGMEPGAPDAAALLAGAP